ncbi:complement C3-like isoform X2 [Danio aesculapii]|uniref:complement C3-like isoform X2 n=1 Tax=Danio aesculapii TaxID=1142201 RepID=UPI0024BF2E53|nr:complement C3-like isoform X2 [Danio aesculapii]
MEVKLLFLSAVLLSSALLTLGDPLYVLSAPNLLRVGSSENVFVEAQDYIGTALNVMITVTNHPKKDKQILTKSVNLNAQNNFQILTDIKIPDDQNLFSDDPLEKQYVYLQAEFPTQTLEKVVMLSFQSGYIFVQTDKSIYTPGSAVLHRTFSLMPNMKPLSQCGIQVEIMNPQGITISSEKSFPVKGMKSGKYYIPEVASLGIWKVITRFANTPQKTFTAEFEVKEYVLPTIEVKLQPSKLFYYVGEESLTVDIKAKYLFGKQVEGNAFVMFGVMDGEMKTGITDSLQKIPIVKGVGTAELTKEMIETYKTINQLVGQSIYVSVSLLTESGSEMVETERRGIRIVTSPYSIHFKKTAQFFKPGMPFDVSIYVTNPDETPAENVAVEVNPGGVRGQTKANGIAKVRVNTRGDISTLDITARTKDPELTDQEQAVKKMTAHAYVPKGNSKNYLHISIDAAELEIGDQMKVYLMTGQSPGVKDQDYTYMILSKGQIVKIDRFKRQGQALITLSQPVTKDMMPSFRFVAYYHVGSDEVVSDSVWVDVKDTCMGKLKLQVKNKQNTYSTGEEVKLQISGDPGARVGLVVVDKALHVLNKNRLTQTKIWDVIEKHDTGCTAGGGRDVMGVFSDAGLMFESNTAGGTDTRTVTECPIPAKRKRRAESLDDDYYTESEEIVSRRHFPESWLWEEIDLCNNCPAPVRDKLIFLKDPTTTWQVLAISLSPTLGICVAEPEEIVVFKSLYIDLKMPYSAVRGEQLEIKAIIHNYTQMKHKVRVEFMESADVCSLASKKGKYITTVTVPKDSSISVPYVIIPMKLGNHMIEVKAAAYDAVYTDGVRRSLKVVSEGVLYRLPRPNVELNPIMNGESPITVRPDIPADRVPDTPAHTYISITGEDTSQTMEQAISGSFMGAFIIRPQGDAEANIIITTLAVIATHYLDSTNQWDTVGVKRRDEAIGHIKTGYQHQLSFRKPDGSYGTWMVRPSSTWLTAYVAKIFTMANELTSVNENVICSALKWLVYNKQLADGSFKEDTAVIRNEIMGGLQDKDKVSLTAFVTIALQEGREICAAPVDSVHESIRKAVAFLEGQITRLSDPYAVALTSYAMAGADKLNKEILMKHSTLGEAGRYWNVPGQLYHTQEATSYAVLALVKARELNAAGEAVHYLGRQHYSNSGFATTQVNLMVFQAVAEYRTQVKDSQNFNLEVELAVEGRSKPTRYTIKRDNWHAARSDKVDINKHFNVTAKGTGKATLSVLTLYYARPVEKKSDCTLFDLSVKIEKEPETIQGQGAIETFKLTMDFFYKNPKSPATMTILDIGIPTGFTVETRDLEELSQGKEKYIQKFELDKALSERGSLILYLDKVSNKASEKIVFRMHKMFEVGLLQPAAVTIYEYYSPNARCTKYYHPKTDGALKTLCQRDLCLCAEETCSYQKKNTVNDDERLENACDSRTDYVYKVTVVGMVLDKNIDIYNLKVEQALRAGSENYVEGLLRIFQAHPRCRDSLGLQEYKSYLIMGPSTDLTLHGEHLQYSFGMQNWVEYWPTVEEGQTPEFRERFNGISKLTKTLLENGCPT